MYCIFLTQTYTVEDCKDYQPLTSNAHQSRRTIPTAVTNASIFGYSDDGWKFGNATSYSRIIHSLSLSFPFSIEFQINELSGNNNPLAVFIYSNGNTPNTGVTYQGGTWSVSGQSLSRSITMGDIIRIDFESGKSTLYINGTSLKQGTHSVNAPTNVEFHTASSRYVRIKNFKIKPL